MNSETKIKVTDYSESKKVGFIYKRDNYYEPILYRYYDEGASEKTNFYVFEKDNL